MFPNVHSYDYRSEFYSSLTCVLFALSPLVGIVSYFLARFIHQTFWTGVMYANIKETEKPVTYPEPDKTYVPDLEPVTTTGPSIEYVREHGVIVYKAGNHATVEVRYENRVSYCGVLLNEDGTIGEFEVTGRVSVRTVSAERGE